MYRGQAQPEADQFLPQAPPSPKAQNYEMSNYSELEDEDFEYHMKHRNRGVAIIINNEKFSPSTGLPDRTGSAKDRDNLDDVLQLLKFPQIDVKNNCTAGEMTKLMQDAAKRDYRDMDCLFVAILSHGDDKRIFGTDQSVSYDSLFDPLRQPQNNSLVGKPKIFIIQACRGKNYDSGSEMEIDGDTAPPRSQSSIARFQDADFLIAHSVVPGYYSWRNKETGSWFIESLCEVIRNHCHKFDIIHLLSRVNCLVSYSCKSHAGEEDSGMKQSPCIISMLTKDLTFN